jgi:hypothetical protein
MTLTELNQICEWVRQGGKLYLGRNYLGQQKLKVAYGPFGIMTKRYNVDERIIGIIQQKVKIQRLVKRKLRVAAKYPAPLRSQTQHAR